MIVRLQVSPPAHQVLHPALPREAAPATPPPALQVLHPALPRGAAQACAKGLFSLFLLISAILPFTARAAYIGATRIDDDPGGQGQIAAISISSISKAVQSLENSLSAVGAEDAAGTAAGVLSWLAMLPSLECADLSRPAMVFLIAPPEGQDLPDQVAVIPLSPVNGEGRLRESLAESYASVSGKTVLYCSSPRDDFALPGLSLIVTRETAYVASSRESLKWIARHWRDGTIPAVPDVRDGATITAFLDAPLAAGVLDTLLAGASGAGETASAVRVLLTFRDLLRGLDSLHASLSADLHAWRIAARLTPAASPDAPAQPGAAHATGAPLAAIPRDALGVADSFSSSLAALLPSSVSSRYGGESAYSFFFGSRLLPGLDAPSASAALEAFLTGESASGFFVSKGEPPARVQAFALADPAAAAAALRTLLPWGTETDEATYRLPLDSAGRTIYGYTARRKASPESDEDYAASALILLARLNCVEFAIDGDNLVVVSGPYGVLENILGLPDASRRQRAIGGMARRLPPPRAGEAVLGAGSLAPSQAFSAIIAALPGLGEISRQLPRHGGGMDWRLSRDGDATIVEAEIATSELLAVSILRRIDQRQIGGILLDHIIGRQ